MNFKHHQRIKVKNEIPISLPPIIFGLSPSKEITTIKFRSYLFRSFLDIQIFLTLTKSYCTRCCTMCFL